MNTSIYNISLLDLLWIMIPVAVVIVIYMRWTQDKSTLFYALFRMLIQLMLIGYVLTYIFNADSPYLVVSILCVMLIAAGIIAMRPLQNQYNLAGPGRRRDWIVIVVCDVTGPALEFAQGPPRWIRSVINIACSFQDEFFWGVQTPGAQAIV